MLCFDLAVMTKFDGAKQLQALILRRPQIVLRPGAVLGKRQTHFFNFVSNFLPILISRLIGLKFLNCRPRLRDLGVEARQLCLVLGNLLIIEALLQNRILRQLGIGLLRNDQWMLVELRLVAGDLRLKAGNLLAQLLDICGSESRVEGRQKLSLSNLVSLTYIEASDNRRIERLKDIDRLSGYDLSADTRYDPVESRQDHDDQHAQQESSKRQHGDPRPARLRRFANGMRFRLKLPDDVGGRGVSNRFGFLSQMP